MSLFNRSIEGIVKIGGVDYDPKNDRTLVILDFEKNPLNGDLYPGYILRGKYSVSQGDNVKINLGLGSLNFKNTSYKRGKSIRII